MDVKLLAYESEWTVKKVDEIMKYLEAWDVKFQQLFSPPVCTKAVPPPNGYSL
eukprot:CAMPEP_0172915162 /NCGR_PEP_ID=MMETSP1075-20121228/193800_1 /TAXON_ID=2916 /ORGANISM="Ceratium fusus, Strain PA161109" /LENGTH=52 /DNA_ID=CAMNT_0013774195 /DNA_START=63 /DNA_END=221 /DNA_ORIENTATION=+